MVIDDNLQQVNQIMRGFDLLTETPKQIYLQQLLGLPTPDYLHVPVIVDKSGYKLSKQTHAVAVNLATPAKIIFELLGLLQQNPPCELEHASIDYLLKWACAHWNIAPLKNLKQVSI